MISVIAQTTPAREILWNVPLWAEIAMYACFAVAVAIAARGVRARIVRWRTGTDASPGKAPGARPSLRALCREIFVQARIWRSPLAGSSHALIFAGFVVLFIGTCIVAVEDHGSRLLGVERWFFEGTFYLATSFALDAFGILFVAGLALALLRRMIASRFVPPARAQDFAIIALFLAIALSGFALEGLRIAATRARGVDVGFEVWSFAGYAIAWPLGAIDVSAMEALHLATWLAHMLATMAFIAILPYSKLRHIIFSPRQAAVPVSRPSGVIAGISLEEFEASERYGVDKAADFTRAQLRSFDACTECGRCQSVCPAHATAKPLSPMEVVLAISRTGAEDPVHALVSEETLWACTSCGACVHECPVSIDQLGAIIDLRRHLVGEGRVRGSAQKALRASASAGNPWGLPAAERAAWAEGLDVPIAGDVPAPEILYWVGCAASYDERSARVARAMVRILRAAGARFAILGPRERCTGDPARRVGDEFTFRELAEANIAALDATRAERIVATCPHCFHTIGNEYPELGGNFEIVHHTQLIAEWIRSGRLKLATPDVGPRVAYHDPCYLGRHNGEFDAPRAALSAAGARSSDPPESRSASFCCGAGGGRMFMEEEGARINEARWSQLRASNPDVVAVSCPFCMTMLRDASAADAASVDVRDVAEIVADRLSEDRAGAGAG